jgi:hypothetical protein
MRTTQLLLLSIDCDGSDVESSIHERADTSGDADTEESVIRSHTLLGPVVDVSVDIYNYVDF